MTQALASITYPATSCSVPQHKRRSRNRVSQLPSDTRALLAPVKGSCTLGATRVLSLRVVPVELGPLCAFASLTSPPHPSARCVSGSQNLSSSADVLPATWHMRRPQVGELMPHCAAHALMQLHFVAGLRVHEDHSNAVVQLDSVVEPMPWPVRPGVRLGQVAEPPRYAAVAVLPFGRSPAPAMSVTCDLAHGETQ